MRLRVHKPAFPLSLYVEEMSLVEPPAAPPSRQRVYPRGAMVLAITLKEPTLKYYTDEQHHSIPAPVLAGPYSRSFQFDPSESTAAISVRFHPGMARAFLPVAAHELHNTDIPLSQLFPNDADRLLNRVCSAPGEDAQFRVLEQYLNEKLSDAAPIPPAVRYAVERLSHNGDGRGVRSIQLDTGLSHTRFVQLFREYVGLTPKLFYRVRRFHTAAHRIEKGLPVKWAAVAADCGYYDQAHLIRDFRAFAGITPREFIRAIPGAEG
jgi:AraC-like DNA-binding protein